MQDDMGTQLSNAPTRLRVLVNHLSSSPITPGESDEGSHFAVRTLTAHSEVLDILQTL